MKNPKLIFINKVINLIKKGWVKGVFACDQYYQQVPVDHYSACKFCLSGAIQRATTQKNTAIAAHVSMLIEQNLPNGFFAISQFNDRPETKKHHVLRVLNKVAKIV